MIIGIVTCDEAGVMGTSGKPPPFYEEDQSLFTERTYGHTVICGRKSWEDFPQKTKPIIGRLNLVVSSVYAKDTDKFLSTFHNLQEECFAMGTLDQAIDLARGYRPKKNIFIMGGSKLLAEAIRLNVFDRFLINRHYEPIKGDVILPKLPEFWVEHVVWRLEKFEVVEFVC